MRWKNWSETYATIPPRINSSIRISTVAAQIELLYIAP
jgi:hypothetical protein